MSKASTIAMWIAVGLLILVYVFPLWEIRLHAPQYPQGLGIDIWVHKITGAAPHDLQNINGLNHYIGMKVIEPGEIPELRFMKWVVAGLIILGVAVAMARRRAFLVMWLVLAIALSVAGMYDFYQWEYSYGHDLNPNAAIKIPGMSYQPPLFGTKQLLNFTTTAWPGLGGIAAMLAVALVSLATLRELIRGGRRNRPHSVATRPAVAAITLGVLLGTASCTRGPQPIDYGLDACHLCRMAIVDQRYGAEIVTRKGRAYKFDSIECMVNSVSATDGIAEEDVAGYYTTDFADRVLIEATDAVYVHSEGLPSPMGMNLTSFATRAAAREAVDRHGGTVLAWADARALVGKEKQP
jgi:copper chaperone NosL